MKRLFGLDFKAAAGHKGNARGIFGPLPVTLHLADMVS
jgi:hypothetical protein